LASIPFCRRARGRDHGLDRVLDHDLDRAHGRQIHRDGLLVVDQPLFGEGIFYFLSK
jgi:hypothetical protein